MAPPGPVASRLGLGLGGASHLISGWILAEHRYRRMVRRSRYIAILTPISALLSMIPDPDIGHGVHPIMILCFSDVGYTRYRVYPTSDVHRYRHNIGIYRHRRISDIGYTRYRSDPISERTRRYRVYPMYAPRSGI